MDKNYWIGRWKRGETGWHQSEVEPRMIDYFSILPSTRVFVPLCGKSLDLKWLLTHGHEVVGVELSEQASREFFQENSIPFQEDKVGPFNRFRGDRITIFNGDYFDLEPGYLGSFNSVYDRAALIALPAEIRGRYTQKMLQLIGETRQSAAFRFLQIVLERTPHDLTGPPFSVPGSEIEKLYGSYFAIECLSREKVEMSQRPGVMTEECVYSMSGRGR